MRDEGGGEKRNRERESEDGGGEKRNKETERVR